MRYYTRLHAEIIRQGRTVAWVAREAGINAQQVSDYCHSRRPLKGPISWNHALSLARVLDVEPAALRDNKSKHTLEVVPA
jgi:hypothetical protein